MLFKSTILYAVAIVFAGQAIAAAVPEAQPADVSPDSAMIAPDPVSACNCPKNCSHHAGSSCKFYHNGNVISGVCNDIRGHLICQD